MPACSVLAACLALAFVAPAPAQETTAERPSMQRLQEEASRPMRWIIESATLDRKRAAAAEAAAAAAASPAVQARAVAEKRKPKPKPVVQPHERDVAAGAPLLAATEKQTDHAADAGTPPAPEVAATATVAAASVKVPADAPRASPEKPPVAAVPVQAQSAVEPRPAAAAAEAPAKPVLVATAAPEVKDDDSEDDLVPLSQETPKLWPGFCPEKCDKYFFRLTFNVLPSGAVEDVKVIDTNRGKHKQMVIAAVSTWRYKPIRKMQQEEVLIRLSADR